MRFLIVLIVFELLFFVNLAAQIKIEVNTSVSGQKFKIEIDENAQEYFITLKVRDSISINSVYENKMEKLRGKYFRLRDKSIKSDSVKLILEEMEILKEESSSYSIYQTAVQKKNNENYDNLIKLFKTESVDFFERREQNKNRITLDGACVDVTVISDDNKHKYIRSHSPNENSHPEIKNLISTTLDFLRDKKILTEKVSHF